MDSKGTFKSALTQSFKGIKEVFWRNSKNSRNRA